MDLAVIYEADTGINKTRQWFKPFHIPSTTENEDLALDTLV